MSKFNVSITSKQGCIVVGDHTVVGQCNEEEDMVDQGPFVFSGEHGPVHVNNYCPNWHPAAQEDTDGK